MDLTNLKRETNPKETNKSDVLPPRRRLCLGRSQGCDQGSSLYI